MVIFKDSKQLHLTDIYRLPFPCVILAMYIGVNEEIRLNHLAINKYEFSPKK